MWIGVTRRWRAQWHAVWLSPWEDSVHPPSHKRGYMHKKKLMVKSWNSSKSRCFRFTWIWICYAMCPCFMFSKGFWKKNIWLPQVSSDFHNPLGIWNAWLRSYAVLTAVVYLFRSVCVFKVNLCVCQSV